jgi:hypothetical protein
MTTGLHIYNGRIWYRYSFKDTYSVLFSVFSQIKAFSWDSQNKIRRLAVKKQGQSFASRDLVFPAG